MGSWSLRWRILLESTLLIVAVAVATTLFDLTGAIVVGVLAVLAGAYRAHYLSLQFSRMTDSVVRTASIDRDHRLSPEGPAELTRMARAVNRLSDRLVSATQDADEERVRLELILDSMAEGVLLVDEEGIVEFANPAALRLLGPDVEYAPGVRLITLNNNYELNELASVPMETGAADNAQIEIRDSGRTVQAIASPFDDRDGKQKSVVILTDITEIKKTETTRREFVNNASHELRTPIAAIKASAETLQRGASNDPEAREDFLNRILEDSGRVEQMIKEMIELSRLESGQVLLNIEEIGVEPFLRDIIQRFRPMAQQARIELTSEVSKGSETLKADPIQIEHAINNLIVNALKAVSEDGHIKISVQPCSEGIEFTVKDDGIGIQPVHLPHIFERFYKADSSRSEGGTGLGLAITRHIVEAHGGSISVQSVYGSGTTFALLIPADSDKNQFATEHDI